MYHGQEVITHHGQPPRSQHCQPWSNMVGGEKPWYHGQPDTGDMNAYAELCGIFMVIFSLRILST